MTFKFLPARLSMMVGIIFLLTSCNENRKEAEPVEKEIKDSVVKENNKAELKPSGPVPVWGTDIKPEMQVVIEKLASLGGKPIESLDAKEARMQPTPTDAVMAFR